MTTTYSLPSKFIAARFPDTIVSERGSRVICELTAEQISQIVHTARFVNTSSVFYTSARATIAALQPKEIGRNAT
jgi:hypothetical protein